MAQFVPPSLTVLLFFSVAASAVDSASKAASLGRGARQSLLKSAAPGSGSTQYWGAAPARPQPSSGQIENVPPVSGQRSSQIAGPTTSWGSDRYPSAASSSSAARRFEGDRREDPDVGEDPLYVNPRSDGHHLDNRELAPILSIPCLKAKQIDPSNGCIGGIQHHSVGYSEGPVSIATFPDWQEARCRSMGEYLCDPGGLLQDGARQALAGQLQEIRETVPVTCGPLLQGQSVGGRSMDGIHTDERRSFNLGTIIVNGYPSSEADDDSLQKLGLVVMANWEMQERFNGVSLAYETCPNAAMLIILPDQRQAFISSSSCEFVCKDRGGPEVVAAALAGLDSGGPAGAAAAGVAEVKRLLLRTSAASTERAGAPRFSQRARDLDRQFAESEEVWSTTQLVVFVVVVGGLLLALIGLVAYAMSPPGAGEAMRKMVRS